LIKDLNLQISDVFQGHALLKSRLGHASGHTGL
jgi:hypothetical protein